MSVSNGAVQLALDSFLEATGRVEEIQDELKPLRKKSKLALNTIKTYMTENNLETMDLQGKTFSFENKEKVVLKMDRVEAFAQFSPEAVMAYKDANTESKVSFKVG